MEKNKLIAFLSEKSANYFKEVYSSLEQDDGKIVTPSDAANYVIETLQTIESIVGDPATFIEDIASGKIGIVPLKKK